MSEHDRETAAAEESRGRGRHRGPASQQDTETKPAGRHRRRTEETPVAA
ncbi:hypothetical protein [Streptomyces sp. KLOTTS4A1]